MRILFDPSLMKVEYLFLRQTFSSHMPGRLKSFILTPACGLSTYLGSTIKTYISILPFLLMVKWFRLSWSTKRRASRESSTAIPLLLKIKVPRMSVVMIFYMTFGVWKGSLKAACTQLKKHTQSCLPMTLAIGTNQIGAEQATVQLMMNSVSTKVLSYPVNGHGSQRRAQAQCGIGRHR